MSGNYSDLAQICLDVAELAAAELMKGYRSRPVPRLKGQADLVTEFDEKSEATIVKALAERAPGLGVMAEEGTRIEGKDGLVFCCDPLHGTTNFVHGLPNWSVSIGLLKDGEAVAGAVVAPALQLRWYTDGIHAYRNGQLCRVSEVDSLDGALLSTGFPAERRFHPENNIADFAKMKPIAQGIRRMGSVAIDLCHVADGSFDGLWERALKPWDTAAGCAMVRAAGGMISPLESDQPLDIGRGHLIASNPYIHDELRAALRQTRVPPSMLGIKTTDSSDS